MNDQAPAMGQLTTGDIVVVKVGQAALTHRIHQPLLVHHSEYFRGALTAPCKEAEEKLITLEDVDPSIFAIFGDWLYHQRLPTNKDECIRASLLEDSEKSDQELLLVYMKAYVFGDRFAAPGFRRAANQAFATIIARCDRFTQPGREVIDFAFKEPILADRVILQCLVHHFCQTWNDDNIEDYGAEVTEKLPSAFMSRVARRFREIGKASAKAAGKTSGGKNSKKDKEKEKEKVPCYLEHEEEEKAKCWALHLVWDQKRKVGYFE